MENEMKIMITNDTWPLLVNIFVVQHIKMGGGDFAGEGNSEGFCFLSFFFDISEPFAQL